MVSGCVYSMQMYIKKTFFVSIFFCFGEGWT